jgi:ATP-dependent helicase/nuclease subunit A
LALKVDGGLVVIDHKSFPGSIAQALVRAAEYTGQLLKYATAIQAALEMKVLSAWIHLPVSGIVVPLPIVT